MDHVKTHRSQPKERVNEASPDASYIYEITDVQRHLKLKKSKISYPFLTERPPSRPRKERCSLPVSRTATAADGADGGLAESFAFSHEVSSIPRRSIGCEDRV